MPSAAGLAPFRVDPRQTAITITYQNEEFIADKVMPRVDTGGERFSWKQYRLGETYRHQDTSVGRTSRPNQVEFGFDEVEATTRDYGLEDPVPQKDIDNAVGRGRNYLDSVTVRLSEKVLLDREKRVADMVMSSSNYAYSEALVGANRFTNYTISPSTPANESNPIGVIETALNQMVRRANTMVLSGDGFSILARHPKIVAAYHGNEGASGVATEEFIKRLFRLRDIFIGSAWVDNTRRGQADSVTNLSRIWGNSLALLHIDPSATIDQGITWGITGQWKTRFAMTRYDPNIGLEGGQVVRVGEHVRELAVAQEYGYLIENAFEAVS